jgi:hydroxymethylbilane synthase
MSDNRPIIIATRGSALALAQSNMIMAQCRAAFPKLDFELKIIKTTGDKMQTASLAQENKALPKGLFTKELEVALLNEDADFAVHSLKDLPTELPDGLKLGATPKRENVRDVLIYRDASRITDKRRGFKPNLKLRDLPGGAVVATSSTRRKAQLLVAHPKLLVTDIRGNVATRMQKLMDKADLDATVLALAGITRLNFKITPEGKLIGDAVPDGLLAIVLDVDVMLPCVGQGAIGIEIRTGDERIEKICERLNHYDTMQAVTAERALLSAMGGGCQSPVGAYAEVIGKQLRMRAVSFMHEAVRRAEVKGSIAEPVKLGQQIAAELKA